jgi:hypothetical protein
VILEKPFLTPQKEEHKILCAARRWKISNTPSLMRTAGKTLYKLLSIEVR